MLRKFRIVINRVYEVADRLIRVAVGAFFVLVFVGFIPGILNDSGIWSNNYGHLFYACMKPVFVLLLVTFVGAFLLLLILTPFVTGDKDKLCPEDIKSPLINLTGVQEKAIVALLKEKGKPTDSSDKMKRSDVIYILNALIEMGYIPEDMDYNVLRLWAIKVTGYREDDKGHFVGDFYRYKGNKKARDTKELIAKRLSSVA